MKLFLRYKLRTMINTKKTWTNLKTKSQINNYVINKNQREEWKAIHNSSIEILLLSNLNNQLMKIDSPFACNTLYKI